MRELRIRSSDGAHSTARVFAAQAEADAETLVVLHPAMGVASDYYSRFAQALARPGLLVVTAEQRGCGTSTVRARRGVDFGYKELLDFDLEAVIAAGRELAPNARLVILGHSLGAHLAALYASRSPDAVAAIIFIAAGTSYYASWPYPARAGMRALAPAVKIISTALGYFPGTKLGAFGDAGRTLMIDWSKLTARGRFELTGFDVDVDAGFARITKPVLALSLEGDNYSPARSMDHLLSKMPQAPVTRRLITPAEVGAPKLDHFRWTKYPQPIADLMAAWLDSVE